MSPKAIFSIVCVVVALVLAGVFYTQLFYTNDATHIIVFQSIGSGKLTVSTAPGTYLRMGASVTAYNKRDLVDFSWNKDPNLDHSIQVRFNDGGHAWVGGNISWEMPADPEMVKKIHTLYGSQENLDRQLVTQAITRAMNLTGPIMSSTESYAARRAEFLEDFADQVVNGIYKTQTLSERVADPITGDMKNSQRVVIATNAGVPIRADESPLKQFGITVLPPTIKDFVYDPKVEEQIQQQRDNIMAIQTAQAQAKKAEQASVTAEKDGEAKAMTAKWEQEVVKAKAVTQAQQDQEVAVTAANRDKQVAETSANRDLNVAQLKAQTAEQYKIEQTKMGEGDAARRQAVMAADGALTQKLDAWLTSQRVWADAFSKYQGEVVPRVVTGGGQGGTQNAATDFMSLMGIKAARDLALDMSVTAPAKH